MVKYIGLLSHGNQHIGWPMGLYLTLHTSVCTQEIPKLLLLFNYFIVFMCFKIVLNILKTKKIKR